MRYRYVHVLNKSQNVFSNFFFSAQVLLDSLCSKDDVIRDSVQACEQAANEGRFRLRDLLAVPMQRVLKYHLILRELVTHTSKYIC